MFEDWDVARWAAGMGTARLAANLVIVAASVSLAWALWGLTRGRTDGTLSPRVFRPIAALIALCGVSHLAVALNGRTPTPAEPGALKLVAAALWVVTAVRFRSAAARLPALAADPCRGPCGGGTAADRGPCAPLGLTSKAERLKVKVRMLETIARNDTCFPDKAEALAELRSILDDLEARPCQT